MKKQIVKITAEEAKTAIESGLWVCSNENGPGAAFIKKSGDNIESFEFPFFRDSARAAALSGSCECHGVKSIYKADACSFEDEEDGAILFYEPSAKEVSVVIGSDIPSSIVTEFEKREEITLLQIRPK